MKLTRKLLALSAISALSFSLAACGDDSGSSSEPEVKDPVCEGNVAVSYDADGKETKTDCTKTDQICKAGKCIDKDAPAPKDKCEGDTAVTYDKDGKETKTDCAKDGKICKDAKCIDKDDPAAKKCTEADNKCDGDKLIKCGADGKLTTTECKAGCDAEKLECKPVPECDPAAFKATCSNQTTQKLCTNGFYEEKGCGKGKLCENGECKDDPCAKCTDSQICKDGKCLDTVEESLIGTACTCEGGDCDAGIVISGTELKSIIKSEGLPPLISGMVSGLVPEAAQITAPNFFSKNIKGCDKITVPEGMAVGCFRDSKIVFNKEALEAVNKVKALIPVLIATIPGVKEKLEAANLKVEDINKAIDALVKKYFTPGIQFTSPNGYCMTAAIDIAAAMSSDPNNKLAGMIDSDAANKLMDKINVGDHAKAKTAKCPAGSVLMTYNIEKTNSAIGNANVGFDICLKQCITDDDCRKADGYKCIELPNGVPGKDADGNTIPAPTEKVCFDQKNIDYFTEMTDMFKPADTPTAK